ncbi:hypothetical protein DFJ73DRAFT_233002 [Zopfochytrium polystomum]|nr:hypothetical protein DFJ73DRAFT_233002 [Zopfochytrium polystomum]
MASIGKKWGQFSQWTGEKLGRAHKTETSEDFKELQNKTEERKDCIEKIHEACTAYVRSMTAHKSDSDSKPTPLQNLATTSTALGLALRTTSEYGRTLIKFGEAHEKLATVQMEYINTIQYGYIGEVGRMLGDLKEYSRLKTKMENRRLDYDAKMNKVQKTKKENPSLEEDARVAQEKYEETYGDLKERMVAINATEADQLQELVAFVDAEVAYHKQSLEMLKALQQELSSVARTETNFRANASRRSQYQGDEEARDSRHSSPAASVMPTRPQSGRLPSRDMPRPGIGMEPPPALPSREPSGGPPPPPPRKQVRVNFDFDAENAGELSIRKGDIINVTVEIDEGWWEGELADGSASGMFPANYTEVIEPTHQKSRPVPRRPGSNPTDYDDESTSTSSSSLSYSKPSGSSYHLAPSSQPGSTHPSTVASPVSLTRQSSPAMPRPSPPRPMSSANGGGGAVGNCGTCGCDEFAENAFKPGICRSCFHKH